MTTIIWKESHSMGNCRSRYRARRAMAHQRSARDRALARAIECCLENGSERVTRAIRAAEHSQRNGSK